MSLTDTDGVTSRASVIVALDVPSATQAMTLIDELTPAVCACKIGKALFTRAGPAVVHALVARDTRVFLDLKFHDIPNTVAAACRAAAELGVWMLNVHVSGGGAMLDAARYALEPYVPRPLLIGVTVLTSLDARALREVGVAAQPRAQVSKLAKLAHDHGLDGVVCSVAEISAVKAACGSEFLTVTPGIRPRGTARDDQARIATPTTAQRLGGDYLVIGRPIIRASDPAAALNAIHAELDRSANVVNPD